MLQMKRNLLSVALAAAVLGMCVPVHAQDEASSGQEAAKNRKGENAKELDYVTGILQLQYKEHFARITEA